MTTLVMDQELIAAIDAAEPVVAELRAEDDSPVTVRVPIISIGEKGDSQVRFERSHLIRAVPLEIWSVAVFKNGVFFHDWGFNPGPVAWSHEHESFTVSWRRTK